MAILVLVELTDGKIKKSSREAVSYGTHLGEVYALVLGDSNNSDLSDLGSNGASKVLHVKGDFGSIQSSASAIEEVMQTTSADTLLVTKSSKSTAIAALAAIKVEASMVSNVVALPDTSAGFKVKQSIFTGNAFAMVELSKEKKVLSLNKNIVEVKEDGSKAEVEEINFTPQPSDQKVHITGNEKTTGEILLPEADIVVSGGRGLKGPENWGMIEDLANVLGAATACSKPVSDMDWRPHHEHVGQTGIKVSPSLYIAIGISGAIQHLAGVNSSKYIVVINKDEEAPFFKAADYGIVGDAFDVVPKLTEAIKASNNY